MVHRVRLFEKPVRVYRLEWVPTPSTDANLIALIHHHDKQQPIQTVVFIDVSHWQNGNCIQYAVNWGTKANDNNYLKELKPTHFICNCFDESSLEVGRDLSRSKLMIKSMSMIGENREQLFVHDRSSTAKKSNGTQKTYGIRLKMIKVIIRITYCDRFSLHE